jgi:hypothetical protein
MSGKLPVRRPTILITSVRKAPGLICQEGSRSHSGPSFEFADIEDRIQGARALLVRPGLWTVTRLVDSRAGGAAITIGRAAALHKRLTSAPSAQSMPARALLTPPTGPAASSFFGLFSGWFFRVSDIMRP